MKQAVEIEREYGPFTGSPKVHGVTFDGSRVWFAGGDKLHSFAPDTGAETGSLDVACDAGTAFDGKHFYQLAGDQIHKVDPASGRILKSIPAPGKGRDSGMAWADGSLWVGEYRERKIRRVDPESGEILRTIESNRFVTGVTWVEGELWHATWEGDESELRHVDAETGEVKETLALPPGVNVSGLEWDGRERFYCGGGSTGKVRAIKRPTKKAKR
jgi:glutamine cyclotransferase